MLHLVSYMYVAIDIGGTKTLVAIFSENGSIIEDLKFSTPKQYEKFLQILRASAKQLKNTDFKAGAVGVRGKVDRKKGLHIRDSVLPWHEVPLSKDLREIFNCSFKIENDAKIAGLSEARLQPNSKKVLYVTISTGIGGAYVVNGEIDPNTEDAEIGCMYFDHDGMSMKWEEFASGHAVYEKYGKPFSDIDDETTWREISNNIAIGLINTCTVLTPDLVIIGGGAGAHLDTFKPYLDEAISSIHPSAVRIPPIIKAKRPDEAVVYGCYELARKA